MERPLLGPQCDGLVSDLAANAGQAHALQPLLDLRNVGVAKRARWVPAVARIGAVRQRQPFLDNDGALKLVEGEGVLQFRRRAQGKCHVPQDGQDPSALIIECAMKPIWQGQLPRLALRLFGRSDRDDPWRRVFSIAIRRGRHR